MTKTYYTTLMVIRSLRRKAHTLIEDSLVEDSADPYGGYHRPLWRQAQTLSGYHTDLYEGEHRYIRRTTQTVIKDNSDHYGADSWRKVKTLTWRTAYNFQPFI